MGKEVPASLPIPCLNSLHSKDECRQVRLGNTPHCCITSTHSETSQGVSDHQDETAGESNKPQKNINFNFTEANTVLVNSQFEVSVINFA